MPDITDMKDINEVIKAIRAEPLTGRQRVSRATALLLCDEIESLQKELMVAVARQDQAQKRLDELFNKVRNALA